MVGITSFGQPFRTMNFRFHPYLVVLNEPKEKTDETAVTRVYFPFWSQQVFD